FAPGDLIRLSSEEGLAEPVAGLSDDWGLRVSRVLGQSASLEPPRHELQCNTGATFEPGAPFRLRQRRAWASHMVGSSPRLAQVLLPESERQARFPLTEHLWLTAASDVRVTACDTASIIRMGDPWTGLDLFHRTILDLIACIQEQETRTTWVEFQRSVVHEAA